MLLLSIEHEFEKRPILLQEARDFLIQSTTLDPASASSFFQLAIVQSELREIDASVVSARQAVELAPGDARTWHLLGMLLASQEEWETALEIMELGFIKTQPAQIDGSMPMSNESGHAGEGEQEGVVSYDFADSPSLTSRLSEASTIRVEAPRSTGVYIIGPRAESLSSPRLLQYPIPSIPFMSVRERFEASTQLLMTQLSLSEKYEGTERANERWPDVFLFFSSCCPSGPPSSSHSKFDCLKMLTFHMDYSDSIQLTLRWFTRIHHQPSGY